MYNNNFTLKSQPLVRFKNWIVENYKPIAVFLMLGLTFVTISHFMPQVFAVNDVAGVQAKFDNYIKGAQETMVGKMGESYSLFEKALDPSGTNIHFTDIVKGLISALGVTAVIVYYLGSLIKGDQTGEYSQEFWFKTASQLAIALICVISISEIMEAIFNLGGILIDAMIKGTGGDQFVLKDMDSNKQKIISMMSQIPGLEHIPDAIGENAKETINHYQLQQTDKMLTYMEYISWFPMVIAVFLMYSAIFEIKLRELFAPYAISQLVSDSQRNSGVRYLKKYGACFLKIAIYFGIAFIGMQLTQYFYNAAITDFDAEKDQISLKFIFMLMSNVVAGMAMMQTGGLADEIVGTN